MASQSKQLLNIYNSMNTLNKGSLEKGVREFARVHSLSATNTNSLVRSMTLVTAHEFRTAMDRCLAWLKTNVANQPYALLVEKTLPGRGIKSSTWLAPVVERALGKAKVRIAVPRTAADVPAIMKAMENGITTFVHGLMIIDEAYTTKTCGCCGSIVNVGSSETFCCSNCTYSADRDVNGARNILLKHMRVVSIEPSYGADAYLR